MTTSTHTLDVDGHALAYARAGRGPMLVLVHGSLGDWRYWQPQLDGLARAFTVVAPSLRRCWPERWDGEGGGYSIERHARDVAALIAHLGEPVGLVGFSRGGLVAYEAARLCPGRVARLALVEPGFDSLVNAPTGAAAPVNAIATRAMQSIRAGDVDGGLRAFFDTAFGAGAWDALPVAARERVRDNAWTLAAQASEVRTAASIADLAALPMPLVCFEGGRSSARNRAIGAALRAGLPRAHHVRIDAAGHDLSATHPAPFGAAIEAFFGGDAIAAGGALAPREPLAEYLRYAARDRAPLNALLWHPAAPTRRAALLVPGFYGSFAGGGHDYAPMARRLGDAGIAFMAINLRTANDFTDPRVESAVDDVAAAVAELERRGFDRIALLGTSLGAPRSMLYLAQAGAPSIRAYGLVAPIVSPYHEAQLRFDDAGRERFAAFLADCRARVAAGRGKDVVVYERWFSFLTVRMTARGFLNVFGAPTDTDIDVPRRGAKVSVPAAIFHGTADDISLPANAQAIHDSFVAAPSRELVWVEGGKHSLEPGPVAEKYAQAVGAWLARVLPATA